MLRREQPATTQSTLVYFPREVDFCLASLFGPCLAQQKECLEQQAPVCNPFDAGAEDWCFGVYFRRVDAYNLQRLSV